MKCIRPLVAAALSILALCPVAPCADRALIGLDTNGTVFQIDVKTGALTQKAAEPLTSFSLGGFARSKNTVYYVGAPSGTTENALYTFSVKNSTLTHVDLDRDGEVRTLFFSGRKLFGLFYEGGTGAVGVYRINPATGATTLVVDLAAVATEPVNGAITKIDKTYFILGKPNGDSSARQLISFKLKANSAKSVPIADAEDLPVLCDKIQAIPEKSTFFCLASPSPTRVDACGLNQKGKAVCKTTLGLIDRVAGGYTLPEPAGKLFYAVVYATGETNNQRILKLNTKGQVKSNAPVQTLIIGAN